MDRRSFFLSAGAALIANHALAADTYPTRPIKLIIPYPPGGGPDSLLRPIAERLRVSLGQPVLLDYKPGASTIIGSNILAKSAPDGYTIGLITDSHSLNAIFKKDLPYNSLEDFEPITQLVDSPLVLLTRPSIPAKNVRELIAYAKANPGKLSYGSPGLGTPHYIALEWFKSLAGIEMQHIPYKGSGEMFTAALAGDIQVMFIGAVTALPYAKDGRLNIIAVAPPKRLDILPDVPTIAESGLQGFGVMSWYGLVAPAKTPTSILTRLNEAFRQVIKLPEIQANIEKLGLIPVASPPAVFGTKLKQDFEEYARIVKLTGARGD